MSKRSPEHKDGFISEKLSPVEVAKIVKEINSPRLRGDEDEEHFTIKAERKTYFVAKHRFIPLVENGKVRQIKINDYLKSLLNKIESESQS